ncbi:MAG: SURF1 family protein [Nocardioides sp.]
MPVPVLLAPRAWPVHLLVVVALVAAGWLGLWQYHGWQDRREDAARDLTNVDPMPLADAIGPNDPFPGQYVGQPVHLSGTWLPDAEATIEGRTQDDRDGHWVVDFVDIDGSLLPVVRGWSSDTGVTIREVASGTAVVNGWLQPSESGGAADPYPEDWTFPELRIADLAQRFDQDLYGAYVVERLPGATSDGLAQADLDQLPDASRFTAIRNLLYAFEWWFFGGFAVFVWWRWARETVAGTVEAEASAGR